VGSKGSASSNPIPLVTFFSFPRCQYIFRTSFLSTQGIFDSTINIHLNEEYMFLYAVCVQYAWESVFHCHHKAEEPKRHKSCLLATQRMCCATGRVYSNATTTLKDPQNVTGLVYLHPIIRGQSISSSFVTLSTQRMCSITGRVYSSATTKLIEPRNITSLICLHPMIRRQWRGNRQLIHSICQSEHPRLLHSSMCYWLHRVL